MSNPFSLLEEPNTSSKPSQKKKQAPKAKSNDKKKKVKKNTKTLEKKPQPQSSQPNRGGQRKPKRVLLVPEGSDIKSTPETTTSSVATETGNKSFDAPASLKNHKRDEKKGYYNRKPGQVKDREDRTGKKFSRNGPKGGEGKYNWGSQGSRGGRYIKKKTQEMNDEEWEKQLKVDQQKQKSEVKRKTKKPVSKKKFEDKPTEDKVVADKDGKKKDFKKKDFKKKDFKKKDFKKKEFGNKVEEEVEEEELSDDEGKETFEEWEKNRKKPITLNASAPRKAREGVKVQQKQLEFTRGLNNGNKDYMKVKKKKSAKKKTETNAESTTSTKKKMKKVSTHDFFKGDFKKSASKGSFKKGSKKIGKKAPNLKDSQSFPTLS